MVHCSGQQQLQQHCIMRAAGVDLVWLLLFLLLLLTLLSLIQARLASDGGCDLAIVVPFTVGPDQPYTLCTSVDNNGGDNDDKCYNAGYSHLVGAALAMEHFNNRHAGVVPELANLLDCPLYLDWNRSRAFNEETNTHAATSELLQHVADFEVPCAVVGPFHDVPALHLSTLGAGWEMPVLPHRAWNLNVASSFHSPYTTQIYPHAITSASLVVQYLRQHLRRTNFVAVLHGLFDAGVHLSQALSVLMDEQGIHRHQLFPYSSFLLSSPANTRERQLDIVLKRVQESGFRTIVCVTEGTYEELLAIAQEATRHNLVGSNYLWLFFGDFFYPAIRENVDPVLKHFLAGTLWIVGIEKFLQDAGSDPFYNVGWASVDDAFLNRVDNELAYEYQKFRDIEGEPEYGTGFMYDAVMATAIGTCQALGYHTGDYSTLSTRTQVDEIRRVNFTGASGRVAFEDNPDQSFFARDPRGMVHIVLNFFPPGTDELYRAPDLLFTDDTGKNLVVLDAGPPIFSNGKDMPNEVLRDLKVQYLSSWVRIFGFTLTGSTMALALVSAIWIYIRREHRILRASQPHFLYQICAGSAILMSSLIPMTFDGNQGWSNTQLDRACVAMPWLMIVGNILIYGALFTKLWRVHRVLQFSRRTVKIKDVGRPVLILLGLALVILLVWTIVDPMKYIYITVDEERGEVLGTCESDHQTAFLFPLMIIMILPALMTEFMAWKTKDVDGVYSESYWIFIMILVQLEIVFFAIPVTIALNEVSAEGQYLGFTIITWVFATSPLGLIIFPKFIAYRKAVAGIVDGPTRGGGTGSVHVTGIASTVTGTHKVQSDMLDSHLSHSRNSHNEDAVSESKPNKTPATSSMPTTVAELEAAAAEAKKSAPASSSMPTTAAELQAAAAAKKLTPTSSTMPTTVAELQAAAAVTNGSAAPEASE